MRAKKASNFDIQRINRTNVYQLLRRNDGLTKQDIVYRLGISLPTVTHNINALQKEGLIKEEGSVSHTGGRRAKTWAIVKDARVAIGLDIKRDYVIAAAVDLEGEIIYRIQRPCQFRRGDAYYRQMGAMVNNVIKSAHLDEKRILGVGIGIPALVTEDNETIFYGEILKITGATCTEFSKYINYKTALYNDASASGFGEFWNRPKDATAFYLSLSDFIGGAIMIENRIYNGFHYHSGEIGHLTLHPGGKPCYCGQKGCVDAYIAAVVLSDLTGGDLSAFFRLVESGDAKALAQWNAYLDDLALTINNIQELFDCTVILGGYMAEHIGGYMGELKKRVSALNPFEKSADYVTVCRYKTWSIAAGAAMNFVSGFINSI